MIFPVNWAFINLFFIFFLLTMVCLIHNLKYQTFFQHLLWCLYKCYHLYVCNGTVCIHITLICFFTILVLHNHTKLHAWLLYVILILKTYVDWFILKYLHFLISVTNRFSEIFLLYDSLVLMLNNSFFFQF